jgi:hypothetical protein
MIFFLYRCIPRPQLGMKFWSIKFVDIALAENILYMCNIDDGLIVKEVCICVCCLFVDSG